MSLIYNGPFLCTSDGPTLRLFAPPCYMYRTRTSPLREDDYRNYVSLYYCNLCKYDNSSVLWSLGMRLKPGAARCRPFFRIFSRHVARWTNKNEKKIRRGRRKIQYRVRLNCLCKLYFIASPLRYGSFRKLDKLWGKKRTVFKTVLLSCVSRILKYDSFFVNHHVFS